MLISVDWLPPYLGPSRRLLRSRLEDHGLVTLPKIAPIPGPRLLRWLEFVINGSALRGAARCSLLSGGQRDDARDRPGEGRHLPGNGDHDLVGVLAAGDQLSIPLAQAHLRLPTDRLNLGRSFSRRSWRCRLTFAGYRYAHAPSTRARRAWVLPALVMPPCRRRSPDEYSEGVRPR